MTPQHQSRPYIDCDEYAYIGSLMLVSKEWCSEVQRLAEKSVLQRYLKKRSSRQPDDLDQVTGTAFGFDVTLNFVFGGSCWVNAPDISRRDLTEPRRLAQALYSCMRARTNLIMFASAECFCVLEHVRPLFPCWDWWRIQGTRRAPAICTRS